MAFPIIPRRRSGTAGNPTSLNLGELAVNTLDGELYLGGDGGVMLLNGPVAAGTTTTEHTGDGTTLAFTFAGYNGADDNGYIVSVGGIDQPPSKYSIANTAGGTITFVEAPVAGELISIRAIVAGSGGGGGTDIGGRAWSNTATYSLGDIVYVNGVYPDIETYVSTQNANTGNNPYSTSGWWKPLTAAAVAIHTRPISDQQPSSGQVLAYSAEGAWWQPSSLVLGKAWNAGVTYNSGDIVSFEQNNGAINIYVSVSNANTANTPGAASAWVQVVQLAAAAPASDGGLATAGITVAGWLQVEIAGGGYYKIPYFQ